VCSQPSRVYLVLCWDSLRTAFRSLRANRLRSVLTVLGIVIGVGSVMGRMSLVEGARANVVKEFDSLGASTIFVVYAPEEKTVRKRRTFRGLTLDDAEAIRQGCDLVSTVSPERSFWDRVVRGNREQRGKISGAGAEVHEIVKVQLAEGRLLTRGDIAEPGYAPVSSRLDSTPYVVCHVSASSAPIWRAGTGSMATAGCTSR